MLDATYSTYAVPELQDGDHPPFATPAATYAFLVETYIFKLLIIGEFSRSSSALAYALTSLLAQYSSFSPRKIKMPSAPAVRILSDNDTNVPQPPPNQSNSTQQGSSKRPFEDAGQALGSAGPASKRPRPLYELTPTPEPEPDTSWTMPPPSKHIIQLRFQLFRFKGVYRTVRIPLSFTFAHLYRLILLLFGWSGYHSHQAEVLTNVITYASPGRTGEVKKHHYWKTPPEPNYKEERDEWRDWFFKYGMFYREPAMRVVRTVRYDPWEVGPRGEDEPVNPNNPVGALWDSLVVPKKRDEDVRLGDLWAPRNRDNMTGGECRNTEIAIKFEYDLGGEPVSPTLISARRSVDRRPVGFVASWEVHVTVETNKDGAYMWETNLPTSNPVVTMAKGGVSLYLVPILPTITLTLK